MTKLYRDFSEELRKLFIHLTPRYVGKTHDTRDDKIKSDGTPAGDLDRHAMELLRNLIGAEEFFYEERTIGEEDKTNPKEMERILSAQDEWQWTIDGLDGTGNRSMRTNSYGAMVARRRGGKILYASIFRAADEKLRGDGFSFAEQGEGAWQWCGDHREYHKLQTAREGELERLLVMLEGGSKKFFKPPITDLGSAITVRPSFSSAIAATTVAQGRASALVTVENKPWDTWPAILMIEEAGGIVTDWQGNPWKPESCGSMVAAGNVVDHARIIALLQKERS